VKNFSAEEKFCNSESHLAFYYGKKFKRFYIPKQGEGVFWKVFAVDIGNEENPEVFNKIQENDPATEYP